MTRRDFVRRAAGVAAAGGLAVAGVQAFRSGGQVAGGRPYFGLAAVWGPVPRGLPLVPVRIGGDGNLVGLTTHLDTYRYCNLGGAPGLDEGFTQDNTFVYDRNPDLVASLGESAETWWRSNLGRKVHGDDFPHMGAGAPVKWRSQGQEDQNVIRGVVIRVRPEDYPGQVRREFVVHGYLCALTHCTHFCCIAGYRESETALEQGVFDSSVFCECHSGVFDVRDVRVYHTPASGRPSEDGVPVAPGPGGV